MGKLLHSTPIVLLMPIFSNEKDPMPRKRRPRAIPTSILLSQADQHRVVEALESRTILDRLPHHASQLAGGLGFDCPAQDSRRPIVLPQLVLALEDRRDNARFERGATTRIEHLARRAGGKGVNVARVLHVLGREVAVTGLAGGFTGRAARAELESAGLHDELVEIEGESRLTTVVAERDGEATGFSELGPTVADEEWAAFQEPGPCSVIRSRGRTDRNHRIEACLMSQATMGESGYP